MNRGRKLTAVCSVLVIALFAGSVISRRKVEEIRGRQATLEDILYLPSGKTVKRLSLGYSSLLADVYWTRAVQYFGSRHIRGSEHYELLEPLLEITTELDPNLIVAYETGSIFLSQRVPEGAGQPDKAAGSGPTQLIGVFISRLDSSTTLTGMTTRRPRRHFEKDQKCRGHCPG
jgi:hypothetical protein